MVVKSLTLLFYSREDVEKLLEQKSSNAYLKLLPDFEKILRDGYDAIEFHLSDEKYTEGYFNSIYYVLYGWDCDSIIVLNSEVVIEIKD